MLDSSEGVEVIGISNNVGPWRGIQDLGHVDSSSWAGVLDEFIGQDSFEAPLTDGESLASFEVSTGGAEMFVEEVVDKNHTVVDEYETSYSFKDFYEFLGEDMGTHWGTHLDYLEDEFGDYIDFGAFNYSSFADYVVEGVSETLADFGGYTEDTENENKLILDLNTPSGISKPGDTDLVTLMESTLDAGGEDKKEGILEDVQVLVVGENSENPVDKYPNSAELYLLFKKLGTTRFMAWLEAVPGRYVPGYFENHLEKVSTFKDKLVNRLPKFGEGMDLVDFSIDKLEDLDDTYAEYLNGLNTSTNIQNSVETKLIENTLGFFGQNIQPNFIKSTEGVVEVSTFGLASVYMSDWDTYYAVDSSGRGFSYSFDGNGWYFKDEDENKIPFEFTNKVFVDLGDREIFHMDLITPEQAPGFTRHFVFIDQNTILTFFRDANTGKS